MNQGECLMKIIDIMKEIGVYVTVEQEDGHYKDVDLTEFILDSFQFINFIVEVESQFGISLPDQYLVVGGFSSLLALSDTVQELTCSE